MSSTKALLTSRDHHSPGYSKERDWHGTLNCDSLSIVHVSRRNKVLSGIVLELQYSYNRFTICEKFERWCEEASTRTVRSLSPVPRSGSSETSLHHINQCRQAVASSSKQLVTNMLRHALPENQE